MIDASCFGLHQGREEEKQGEDEVTSCHPFSHLRRYDVHHHHRHRLRRKPQVLHPLCTHLFPPLSVITSCLPRPLVCKQALRAPSHPRNISNMRAHHLDGMRENCDLVSTHTHTERERERERKIDAKSQYDRGHELEECLAGLDSNFPPPRPLETSVDSIRSQPSFARPTW